MLHFSTTTKITRHVKKQEKRAHSKEEKVAETVPEETQALDVPDKDLKHLSYICWKNSRKHKNWKEVGKWYSTAKWEEIKTVKRNQANCGAEKYSNCTEKFTRGLTANLSGWRTSDLEQGHLNYWVRRAKKKKKGVSEQSPRDLCDTKGTNRHITGVPEERRDRNNGWTPRTNPETHAETHYNQTVETQKKIMLKAAREK